LGGQPKYGWRPVLDVSPGAQLAAERIALLDAIPELARGLARTRLAAAADALRIETAWIAAGPLGPDDLEHGDDRERVVLLRGLVVRSVRLEDGTASELLGPGDVLCPPMLGPQDDLGLPGYEVRLQALETSRVGIVDVELIAALAGFPDVIEAFLAARARRDAERAATAVIAQLTGVDRRLVALFRLLAARHGRPTPEGIAVPVAVPHRLLAELVGARRPTVSTALRRLERSGRLRRLQDGSWLLRA
jgi:CRP/FNR family cyclic AMP-dependent transcriptional regulator